MTRPRIAFVASPTPEAQAASAELAVRYGACPPQDAEIIVALGGDGHMLQTMHEYLHRAVPIYGMNCGSVGFLMNDFSLDNLPDRLAKAEISQLHPLRMTAHSADGTIGESLAINEVALLRETRQAAKLAISVDGRTRLAELICDGILVSTPAGSTAYNLSAHGPIIPIGAPLLALTPISAFRPRRWRGALLPHTARVEIVALEAGKRPVSATADHSEFRDVTRVVVEEAQGVSITVLFDAGHNLDERILAEQFVY